ncbi:[histone H3]-lysine(4) N-trimethyltransferase [Malassezia nana]|uniref:Histone-lysine N-methyltransferase, H3 lysine-79 specific n=1 Tax=Malassezia nana TaxID=180528 RepID=A0AAF0J134_9BASI|nr:[histone H3]-lysine(4) N-trimethyltransferase [Malassezia nana]
MRAKTAPPKPPAQRPPARHNALPEALQLRIARERQASQAAQQSKSAPVSKKARVHSSRSSPHDAVSLAKATRIDDEDDADDAALDRLARSGSSLQVTMEEYCVPRAIVSDASYDPLAADVRTQARPCVSSRQLVESASLPYMPFFHGLDDHPIVTLEYPAPGATEEFLLLVPKMADEYDPISDLLRAVRAMVANYIPEDQREKFGSVDSLETGSNAGAPLDKAHRLPGRVDVHSSSKDGSASPAHTEESILRSFTKARNRRNGPLFVQTVERFNAAFRALKETGVITSHLEQVGQKRGVPEDVWRTIQEQVYARAAAPHVDSLKHYEAFSDSVYGEMLPPFLNEVERIAGLGTDSVFVDLGSGIGNCLLQASLQTGCEAYGCEYMPAPSRIASQQLVEAAHRWRMWHLRAGPRVEAWADDFTESSRVREVLRRADAVLVNKPQTNDTLSLLFLDLKEGAKIFSLRPFVAPDFRLTERTLSSPQAILCVEQRTYTSGCVSWTAGGGTYYVHTVDRSMIQAFARERESHRAAGTE